MTHHYEIRRETSSAKDEARRRGAATSLSQAMPFARKAPTPQDLERLDAESRAALDALHRGTTQSEEALRESFARFTRPPDDDATFTIAGDADPGGAAPASAGRGAFETSSRRGRIPEPVLVRKYLRGRTG